MSPVRHLLIVLAIGLGCIPLTANSEADPIRLAGRSVAEAYPRPSGSSSAVVPVGAGRDTTDADTTRQADRKSPGRALARSPGGTVLSPPSSASTSSSAPHSATSMPTTTCRLELELAFGSWGVRRGSRAWERIVSV